MLDAISRRRRATGQSAVSIQWGVWAEAGAWKRQGGAERMASAGIMGYSNAEGLHALGLAIQNACPAVVAFTKMDWSVYTQRLQSVPSVFAKFASVPARTINTFQNTSPFLDDVVKIDPCDRISHITQKVSRVIESELGVAVEPQDSLMAVMDSLSAMQLLSAIQQLVGPGTRLPPSLMLECDSILQISEFIDSNCITDAPVRATLPEVSSASRVVISGMACRLAGGVQHPLNLWDALLGSCCEITDKPPCRWAALCDEASLPAKHGARFGSFLSGVELFDAEWFGLSHTVTAGLDPHIRLMLETAAEAMNDASLEPGFRPGHQSGQLTTARMGVFTAAIDGHFSIPQLGCNVPRSIAQVLDLNGICKNYQLECTSSHAALHRAKVAINNGECDGAVVVGAALRLKLDASFKTNGFMAALSDTVLSMSGACRPFDRDGDGMVCGEGAAAIILQSKSESSQCYADFCGSAQTQNRNVGGQSLYAPDVEAQATAIQAALRDAHISCHEVSLTHVHGIGQQVSDTSEVLAIRNMLLEGRNSASPLHLINHKGNFGHTVQASGLLSVINTVLSLMHGSVPAHVSLTRPIKAVVDCENQLVMPTRHPVHMEATLATVHGHASSGVNVHLVLQRQPNSADVKMLPFPTQWCHVVVFPITATHRSLNEVEIDTEAFALGLRTNAPALSQDELRTRAASAASGDHAPGKFRSETESIVATVCAGVIGLPVELLCVDANLLQLGLTSLGAALLRRRLHDEGLEVGTVATVLLNASVEELAALAPEGESVGVLAESTGLIRVERGDGSIAHELSYSQKQMWVLYELDRSSAAYSVPTEWRLPLRFDVAVFARAVEYVAVNQEMLRVRFGCSKSGAPVQWVVSHVNWTSPLREMVALHRDVVDKTLRRELATVIDLEVGVVRLLAARCITPLGDGQCRVLLNVHHIATDGMSGILLEPALFSAYRTLMAGDAPKVAASAMGYLDWAAWQRAYLDEVTGGDGETRMKQQLAYWRETLADVPVLELPCDHARPAQLSTRGGVIGFELDCDVADAFMDVCRGSGATSQHGVLAAWAVLLSKHAGQDDVVIGVPYANRGQVETHTVVGYFVNTLAVRVSASGGAGFHDVVSSAKQAMLDAMVHGDVPFVEVVKTVKSGGVDLSRTPIYQTTVAVNASSSDILLADAVGSAGPDIAQAGNVDGSTADFKETSQFEMSLHLTSAEKQAWACSLEYSSDLFDHSTATRAASRFVLLLEQMVESPAVLLRDVSSMGQAERALVLEEWNDTSQPYPEAATAHALFEAQATPNSGAMGLAFEGHGLSYGELLLCTSRMAVRLRGSGVGSNTVVGLCAEKSIEEVACMLGIMRACAAYVPLDPKLPSGRLQFLVEQCECNVVMAQSQHAHLAKLSDAVLVIVAENVLFDASGGLQGQQLARDACESRSLAYVLFTSGSTGKPKGVMVEHRSLVAFIVAEIHAIEVRAEDRMLHSCSMTFDPSLWLVFTPLVCGACVVLGTKDAYSDPSYLRRLLLSNCIAFTDLAPIVLAAYLGEVTTGAFSSCFRTLYIGGDVLPPTLVLQTLQAYPQITIWNIYGPTEVTITSHSFECALDASGMPNFAKTSIPIGKLIEHTTGFIVDPSWHCVPVGVAGELLLGGVKVARGYIGRQDLTDQAFVWLPALPGAGRLYKTGDRVRWLQSGDVDFLGRVDFQIKLNGQRIETGEIEAVICGVVGMDEALVLLHGGGETGLPPLLVAYVMTQHADATAASEACRNQLPRYMVPSVFMTLDAWPLNSAGKIDRKQLPAPQRTSQGESTLVLPSDPLQASIARVFKEVLRMPHVDAHANFFMSGGDSILAIRAMSAARRAGVEFSVSQLMQHPTVAQLASVARVIEDGEVRTVVGTGSYAGDVMLTPVQRWFFSHNFRQVHHWNQAISFHLVDESMVDSTRLHGALVELAAHHEMLRCRYRIEEDGTWAQYIPSADTPFVTELHIITAPTDGQAESALTQLQASFDLVRGPVWNTALIRGPYAADRVGIVLHHLVIDAVSWRILEEDLSCTYFGRPLARRTTNFAAWSQHLDQFLETQKSWAPAPCPVLHSTAHVSSQERTLIRQRSIEVRIARNVTGQLLKLAHNAFRTKPEELMLTALALGHYEWCGERCLGVLLEGHGRHAFDIGVDVSHTVGWFTAQWPVVLNMSDSKGMAIDDGVVSAICLVKEQLRSVPDHIRQYGIPFRGDNACQGLPDLLFNYLGQFGTSDESDVDAQPTGAKQLSSLGDLWPCK